MAAARVNARQREAEYIIESLQRTRMRLIREVTLLSGRTEDEEWRRRNDERRRQRASEVWHPLDPPQLDPDYDPAIEDDHSPPPETTAGEARR